MNGKKIQISKDCYIKIGKDCDGNEGIAIYTFGEKRLTLKPDSLERISNYVTEYNREKIFKRVRKTTANA